MGVAVDAAARGLDVVLVEAHDFGKGTSSRSTKLVHGGVRYLEQGNIPLVMSALKERGLLRQNAPHLVHDLAFVVPNYSWWEAPFYGIGLEALRSARRQVWVWRVEAALERGDAGAAAGTGARRAARRRGLLRRPVRRRATADPSRHDGGRSWRDARELLPGHGPAARLRPFNSRLSICERVTSSCNVADSVCRGVAEPTTCTLSVMVPTVRLASSDRVELESSLLPVLTNFLKPGASTATLYRLGGRLDAT